MTDDEGATAENIVLEDVYGYMRKEQGFYH